MTHYLNDYFDYPVDAENENRTLFSGGSGAIGPQKLPRRVALYAAAFTLALTATCVILFITSTNIPLVSWILLILIFLGAFFYSMPPVSLATSGYGELSTSVLVAGLIPAFAFTLQTGEFHRLLIMSSTPLIALHLAMMITFEFPDYAVDKKFRKQTLLVRLDWPVAIRLHNAAILFAIGSILVAFLFGFPWRVALNTLIALPLALAQIWQVERIRQGYPPNWRILTLGAIALFGLTAYLQLIGYVVT
jgi:1,4-dihydroxy-2-naphthoate octaprenyltransferase